MTKVNKQQFDELKEILTQTNEKINNLQTQLTDNHKELLEKVSQVEETLKEALRIAQKNEADIFEIKNKQDKTKTELKTELLGTVNNDIKHHEEIIRKLEVQLKGALIELDDMRNRSMRSTLIFKNIPEKSKETWEDTCDTLANFIDTKLDLPYSYEDIDMTISRAHRGSDDPDQNGGNDNPRVTHGPKPIFAKFNNWRIAEEIRNAVIRETSKRNLNVYVSQMYSKSLTARRNEALKFRRDHLNKNPNTQVKLDYPATLRSRPKGSRGGWKVLQSF